MIDEQKLIPLLQQAAARWLSMVHQDTWDSDGFTYDLGKFCNRVAEFLACGTLSDTERKKVWSIFAPTCQWENSVEDQVLRNQTTPPYYRRPKTTSITNP